MSDFLKKFKSVFIAEDSPEQTPQSPQDPESPPSPAVAETQPPTGGTVSGKFTDALLAALEKNNQDGFDYFEYRQALINLGKMSMDEKTRFQSAFAMAQTMGANPGKLIDSARFYLTVLANEQSKFEEAHEQQRAKLIGSREDDLKNLAVMIQQKTDQINQLTQQIEDHRKQSEQMKAEISESTVKIENTKADFDATYANVTANIQADIDKIQQYLS